MSKEFTYALTNLAIGTSFPAVTNEDILAQKITLPAPDIFTKVVDVLENAEVAYMESLDRIEQTVNIKKSLFNRLFKGDAKIV